MGSSFYVPDGLNLTRASPDNSLKLLFIYLFSLALQLSAGYGILVSRGFLITHNDAPQLVGLLLDE
jgi:hypothetical protein